MATVTLSSWQYNPATTNFANAPWQNFSTTTGSIVIYVDNPLISLGYGYWKEKTQQIGDNRNQESEGFTFGNLTAGWHYLNVYAINADESVYYNTDGGTYGSAGYWVRNVGILVTSPAQCTFSNTPTVNSDVTGDTGAANGADATIARVDTNWSAACQKQVAWSYSTTTTMGQVSNGTDVSVPRGNSVYLYAGAPGATFLRSAATTIPYLSPKRTGITVANAPVTASADTGYWTATLSGVDTTKHTNYAVASSASTADSNSLIHSGQDVEGAPGLDPMDSGVNGSAITVNQTTINTSVSNAPVGTGTTTMYLWCSRTSDSGGSGGQGWGSVSWMPVLDGSGNTVSFTVTRSNENVQNAAGSYYDSSTDTGAKHSVTLTGLVAGKYYNVADAGGNGGSATWANGSSAATATLTINDAAQTVPSGTGSTTTTYTIWSNSSASWSGASSLGTTYTRTLLNYDRYTPAGFSLDTSVNSGTYTLQNTISGHTYYIRKSSTTGAIVGQATATGTSTDFTITLASGDLGTTIGNQTTLYLTIKSPFNESPGSDYNSGKTITVTRTGTTQQADPPAASTYGMKIWNNSGTLIYDTTSKIGRIAITGRTAAVNGQASSAYVTVTGMTNSTNWNVIVQPYETAATTDTQRRLALRFSVTKENNRFKINNEQDTPSNQASSATSYDYVVMRSG